MGFKKGKTRELILEVSYMLFAKNGFDKITMKDICEATNLSRGGLYSHFSGSREIFEALLERLNKKDEMNFDEEMGKGTSAMVIMNRALALMETEMTHPEHSLSLALYEYSVSVDSSLMQQLNQMAEKKWAALLKYGMERGEFGRINIDELVKVILYTYQGVRMWSRIITMSPKVSQAIASHIRACLGSPNPLAKDNEQALKSTK